MATNEQWKDSESSVIPQDLASTFKEQNNFEVGFVA